MSAAAHLRRLLAPAALAVAALALSGAARAAEVIHSFDSHVVVARDGELTVTETIRVRAEGTEIRRVIYRDFPLTSIHSQAEIAAEASRCALEQGKFWEYHDQMFAASSLEKDSLVEYARNLKLDEKQFSTCLTSEKYKADIDKDAQEGRKAGVTGTPGFFVNGVALSGAQPKDAFTRVIDDELSRKDRRASISVQIKRADR